MVQKRCRGLSSILSCAALWLSGPGAVADLKDYSLNAKDKELLATATEATVYLIDPGGDEFPDKEHKFHGHFIFNRVELKDSELRKKVIDAFQRGIQDSNGTAAHCFLPRHGLRVSNGKRTEDYLICFECLQIYCSFKGRAHRRLLTTQSPQKLFDSLFSEGERTAPPEGKTAVVVTTRVLDRDKVLTAADVTWRFIDESVIPSDARDIILNDPDQVIGKATALWMFTGSILTKRNLKLPGAELPLSGK